MVFDSLKGTSLVLKERATYVNGTGRLYSENKKGLEL